MTGSAKMDAQGRLLLPAGVRRAMDLQPGTAVLIRYEQGKVVLENRDRAIAAIQARLKARRKGKGSAVEEFLAERRREGRRELER